MPVHEVTENGKRIGWRWGQSGKLYKSREQAEAQARAIYSTGWRGDSARREVAKALAANKAAETQYTNGVLKVFRGVHAGILSMVENEILPRRETRADTEQTRKANELLNARLNKRIAQHLREKVGPMYDLMAKRVTAKHSQAFAMIGIPVNDLHAGVAARVAVKREDNLRLIEDAGRDYADDVRDVITAPQNQGLRAEELRDMLVARGSVSLSRATLVAVDQTLKLAAAVSQARQRAAGVSQYRWSSSQDERVRPTHAALEGQVFDWDDPPVTNDDGDTNAPGEDYRCRCVAIPQIAELDQESEEDVPDEVAAE